MEQNPNPQQSKTLNELGLQGNETKVYLTLLSLGTNPVSTLAKKSGLNRCTCYAVIERLIQKGFIGQIIKNNIAYFTAVEPIHLLNHLKTKHQELEKKIYVLGKSIGNINQTKKDHQERPKVVFFEGKTGIRNIMEDTLDTGPGGEVLSFNPFDELNALLPDYLNYYMQQFNRKKITLRTICTASELSYCNKIRQQNDQCRHQLIPPEFDCHLYILIYNNKVAISSMKAKFGIIIQNREMFEAFKKTFNLIWSATAIFDRMMTRFIEEKMALKKAPNYYNPEPFKNID